MLEFKNKTILEESIKNAKKKTTLFSILRAILAISTIIFIICLLSIGDYLLYGLLSGGFFILFMITIILSNPFYKRVRILENKRKVYERHMQRREKKFSHFSDNGAEFKDKEDYKLSDLDVFGPKSLYQYLSEAKTPLGRSMLANQLKNPIQMEDGFTNFVNTLANNEDSLELEASLMEFKKGQNGITTNEFESVVHDEVSYKFWYILPILSFILMLIFNFISSKIIIKDKIYRVDANSYYYLADLYVDLSESIKNTNISDPYYNKLKEEIINELPLMKKIRGIYTLLLVRRNLLLNIILNIIFSFDAFLILYLKAKISKGMELKKSIENIAILEVALSFKNIGMDNLEYTIPEDNDILLVKDMKHPFVKDCIPNSITLDGGIVLTGSNMSGKTTFMRTLGICMLLKNASSIVPAVIFKAPSLNIYTSLRANDMLQEGVSTFYAEIKRMNKINQAIKKEKCLILVDEIFKGTNALERIEASRKVIEKLNMYHAIFIISTHDFELCETKGIKNYHFEESYNEDKISFDYKLKEGPGIKGNALYLLKMSGIIE